MVTHQNHQGISAYAVHFELIGFLNMPIQSVVVPVDIGKKKQFSVVAYKTQSIVSPFKLMLSNIPKILISILLVNTFQF